MGYKHAAFPRKVSLKLWRGTEVASRNQPLTTPACSPAFYLNVTNAVEPHPRLVFSIKHTALDFWRRVALNPTLGIGQHRQVVEAGAPGSCACALACQWHARSCACRDQRHVCRLRLVAALQ